MFEEFKNLLVSELNIENPDDITMEASLANDLSINSLELADLVLLCEEKFNIEIDEDKNKNFTRGVPFNITKEGAKVQVWIIPTDEEYMIALDTKKLAFN